MFSEDLVKKFNYYLASLKKEDKIGLLFHSDADGVCSGVIIAKTIEKLRGKKIDLYFSQGLDYALTEKTFNLVKDSKCNKFIVVDMAVDTSQISINKLIRISEFADVLILDHHTLVNNINNDKIIFGKVQLFDKNITNGSVYPASKLVYDLCLDIIDISDLDWVSCVGLIGDMQFRQWKEFVNKTLLKYKTRITETGPENIFGKIGALINAAKIFDMKNLNLCFDVIYEAENPKSVLNSKLRKFKEEIDYEMNFWIEKFKEVIGENGLFIYEIKPKFPVNSSVSTILSFDYLKHDETLVVISDLGGDIINVSARRQDSKSNMAKFVQKAAFGIEGSNAGGNIPAAGATIPRKEIGKFKKKLIELYNKSNGRFD